MRTRLDQELVSRKLVTSRSQAENFIKLAGVLVNGQVATKPGMQVGLHDKLKLTTKEQYVSRAGLKLASVAPILDLDFRDKTVLDVGSSTGGFTDYALQHDARKVIAVDVGTDQLHPRLRNNPQIELYEQTDIRNFAHEQSANNLNLDIIMVDVSFISLREVLPYISRLMSAETQLVAMVKPQFEAGNKLKNKGVIKNDTVRRDILKQFEIWAQEHFVILNKADSAVAGTRGNRERFYLLKKF